MTELLIETPEDSLPVYDEYTPRELRLRYVGTVLSIGAIINALLAFIAIGLGAIAASNGNTDLLITLADILAGRFGTFTTLAKDAALVAGVLFLLVNICLFMVSMVGISAQEFWGLIFISAIIVANVLGLVLIGFFPAIISILIGGWAFYHSVQDFRAYRTNPVMLKEIRERMRGARAFVVITIYLGLMSGFALLLYLVQRGVVQNEGSAVIGELGRTIFAGVVGIELLLIIFIAPAFTSGAVTGERERKTFDLLQITLLPRSSFIIGKLESALSYIFLLLLAAIPLQSVAFLFGGISETELVLAFIILTVTAITLGAVGLFFSTVVDRTLTASVRAYTVAFGVIIGLPIVFSYFLGIFNNAVVGTGSNVTSSPATEAALIYLGGFLVSLNPIATATATQQLLIDQQTTGFWTVTLNSNGSTIPMISPWISFTIIYLTLSTILMVLAVRRMRRSES